MSQLVKTSNQPIVTEDYLITVVARILLYIALHNKGKIYVLKFKKLKRLLTWKILRYDGVKLTSKQVEKIYKMFENLKIGKKMDEGYLISMNASPIQVARQLIKEKRDINIALEEYLRYIRRKLLNQSEYGGGNGKI
jgi:uncharacterized membrane protein